MTGSSEHSNVDHAKISDTSLYEIKRLRVVGALIPLTQISKDKYAQQ